MVGVFCTWTRTDAATLNGTEGPNDGWLVVIFAVLALGWTRMTRRESWAGAIGVLGLLGAALVICWTAIESWIENRRVIEATVGYGLLLTVGAGALLGVAAALRGAGLLRSRRSR